MDPEQKLPGGHRSPVAVSSGGGKAISKEDSIPFDVSRVHYLGDFLNLVIDLYTCDMDSAPEWYYEERLYLLVSIIV
ncbi:hypothetical protein N7451_007932 [Penicillium sp. IBT 35674x]|nr:hypothetical protein N7451_007932 [Penicillium sp. IBT 35674x]